MNVTALSIFKFELSDENGVFPVASSYTCQLGRISGATPSTSGSGSPYHKLTDLYYTFPGDQFADGAFCNYKVIMSDLTGIFGSFQSATPTRIWTEQACHFYGAAGMPTKFRIATTANVINHGKFKVIAYKD
jgi:hypothetical protein